MNESEIIKSLRRVFFFHYFASGIGKNVLLFLSLDYFINALYLYDSQDKKTQRSNS